MSRLEEIKNQYAQTLEFKDWNDLRSFHILEDVPGLEEFENEVTQIYAKECVKASLEEAFENAELDFSPNEPIYGYVGIKEESITNPENIILL